MARNATAKEKSLSEHLQALAVQAQDYENELDALDEVCPLPCAPASIVRVFASDTQLCSHVHVRMYGRMKALAHARVHWQAPRYAGVPMPPRLTRRHLQVGDFVALVQGFMAHAVAGQLHSIQRQQQEVLRDQFTFVLVHLRNQAAQLQLLRSCIVFCHDELEVQSDIPDDL